MDLRTWIDERGMKLSFIEKKLGCSKGTISMLLSGTKRPSEEMMERISYFTLGEVTKKDIFEGFQESVEKYMLKLRDKYGS